MSGQLLEHETPDARSGIDGRQDEQRLEHDREVVPERGARGRRTTPPRMLAMPTASVGAPPVRDSSVASPICVASACICSGVTMKPHSAILLRRRLGRAAERAGR